MKKKTIFYTGVNGDKNVLMLENPKRAETLFNSGQAIEINPSVWALDPKEYQGICQTELKMFIKGMRGARLSDIVKPKSVQRKERIEPKSGVLYVFFLIIMSEDPMDNSEDPLQKYSKRYTASSLEEAKDMARAEFPIVHWIKSNGKELAEPTEQPTQVRQKSYATIPLDTIKALVEDDDMTRIKETLKSYL